MIFLNKSENPNQKGEMMREGWLLFQVDPKAIFLQSSNDAFLDQTLKMHFSPIKLQAQWMSSCVVLR